MSIGMPKYRDKKEETLDDNKVLTAADAYHQILDAGGSGREVDLPSGTGTQGGEVMITNSGGEDLTIKQSDSSATVAVVSTTESALFVCTGVSAAAGWQAAGLAET